MNSMDVLIQTSKIQVRLFNVRFTSKLLFKWVWYIIYGHICRIYISYTLILINISSIHMVFWHTLPHNGRYTDKYYWCKLQRKSPLYHIIHVSLFIPSPVFGHIDHISTYHQHIKHNFYKTHIKQWIFDLHYTFHII